MVYLETTNYTTSRMVIAGASATKYDKPLQFV